MIRGPWLQWGARRPTAVPARTWRPHLSRAPVPPPLCATAAAAATTVPAVPVVATVPAAATTPATVAAAALRRLAQRLQGVEVGVEDVAGPAELALDEAAHVLGHRAPEVVRQQQRVLDAAEVLLVVDAARPIELRLGDRVTPGRANNLLVEIKSACEPFRLSLSPPPSPLAAACAPFHRHRSPEHRRGHKTLSLNLNYASMAATAAAMHTATR